MNLNVSLLICIDKMIEEVLPDIMNKDPLGTYLSDGDLGLFDVGSTTSELDSNLDSTPHLESSSWVSNYESLPPLASSPAPPSVISPPRLELKPLPDSLKYVFIGPKKTLHIIISSLLCYDQEREFIRVLNKHTVLLSGQLLS